MDVTHGRCASCVPRSHPHLAKLRLAASAALSAALVAIPAQMALASGSPTNIVKPALPGTAPLEGQSLSVSNGIWTNSPTSYHYQWWTCNAAGLECSTIAGAATSTYTPTAADLGRRLRAVVTARNAFGEASATASLSSTVAAAIPVNTVAPSISPVTPRQGTVVIAATGSWTYGSSYSYKWQDCNAAGEECADIPGATSARYSPTSSDVGELLEVVVTAFNYGETASASSGNSGRLVLGESVDSFYVPHGGTVFSAPNSVWNTPEIDNSKVDSSSKSLVGTVSYWGSHNTNGINTTAYSSPIYTVPAGQPTTAVVLDWGSPPLNTALDSVPIPPEAMAASGRDETLAVYQPSSNQMWEFWHMREGLVAPSSTSLSASMSPGGRIAAGTYYYAVTALSADGETTPSEPLEVLVPRSGSKVTLSFKGVIYGRGYKIYRGSEPADIGYVGAVHESTDEYGETVAFADTGGMAPTLTPPAIDTAWTPGQWHAGWAGHIPSVSTSPGYYRLERAADGTISEEPTWGATASSLPATDGMITLADLQQRQIGHALQLLVPTARGRVHSYPAQRSDGTDGSLTSIPEGAHFVLDRTYDCGHQATPFMRMACVAAQRYGLIVNDQTGGGLALRAEDPTPLMQAGGMNPYAQFFTDETGTLWHPYQMMAAFPWSRLRLLPMQLAEQGEYHP